MLRHVNPVIPALLTGLLFFALAALWTAPYGYNPSVLVRFGAQNPHHRADLIPPGSIILDNDGYDGQSYYYVSLDLGAKKKLVEPIRYQRVGLPLVAWIISFGRPWGTIVAMIALNLFAPPLLVWVLGQRLRERGLSPWWALLAGINPGTVLDFYFTSNSTLMSLLLILGWFEMENDRGGGACIAWAFALLTRETAAVPLAAIMAFEAYRGRLGNGVWTGLAFLPLLAWQWYLSRQLGVIPLLDSSGFLTLPGVGVLRYLASLPPLWPDKASLLAWSSLAMILVSIGTLAVSVRMIRSRPTAALMALLANIVFFLSMSDRGVWAHTITSSGRLGMGIFTWLAASFEERPVSGSLVLGIASVLLGLAMAGALTLFPPTSHFLAG